MKSNSKTSWAMSCIKKVGLASVLTVSLSVEAADIKLRLAATPSATDIRAVAMETIFKPEVSDFAAYQGFWSNSLFKQGTEIEAMARGNLELGIVSAQELAEFIPEFSIFTAGYVHKNGEHQKKVFDAEFMSPLKNQVEEMLGVKLLSVMYTGKRHLNLRIDKEINSPEDLAGVKLRMPGSSAWLFLGSALGASPTPLAFSEVYTALQTGAIDGQDNPLPTNKDQKFYEVTKQVVLTGHLADLNYIAISMKAWDELSEEQKARVQKASDSAALFASQEQAALESKLVDFFIEKGLKVYEPDVAAFRERVLEQYQDSEISRAWSKGMIDKINNL